MSGSKTSSTRGGDTCSARIGARLNCATVRSARNAETAMTTEQERIFIEQCVVHRFIETGEQPPQGFFATVCSEHADKTHPELRAFLNERAVA